MVQLTIHTWVVWAKWTPVLSVNRESYHAWGRGDRWRHRCHRQQQTCRYNWTHGPVSHWGTAEFYWLDPEDMSAGCGSAQLLSQTNNDTQQCTNHHGPVSHWGTAEFYWLDPQDMSAGCWSAQVLSQTNNDTQQCTDHCLHQSVHFPPVVDYSGFSQQTSRDDWNSFTR